MQESERRNARINRIGNNNYILNDFQLQRLSQEAYHFATKMYPCTGEKKKNDKLETPSLDFNRCREGLKYAFRKLRFIVPMPCDRWFYLVFNNYDIKKNGCITYFLFHDIVRQFYKFHLSEFIKKDNTNTGMILNDCLNKNKRYSFDEDLKFLSVKENQVDKALKKNIVDSIKCENALNIHEVNHNLRHNTARKNDNFKVYDNLASHDHNILNFEENTFSKVFFVLNPEIKNLKIKMNDLSEDMKNQDPARREITNEEFISGSPKIDNVNDARSMNKKSHECNSHKVSKPGYKEQECFIDRPELASHIVHPNYYGDKKISDDYVFGGLTGKGNFGCVQVVTNKRTNQMRACKTISIKRPEQWEMIKSEIELLKSLNHPNIMKLYETYFDGRHIFLIIELCKGGQLFDRIIHHYEVIKTAITEQQVCDWIQQILSAASYCHERGIIHRDIKPENILFLDNSPTSSIKIIDFGLSDTIEKLKTNAREVKQSRRGLLWNIARVLPTLNGKHIIPWEVRRKQMQRAGTPHYMAPEMIRGNYDEKSDVFSIGIIMYQLLSGIHPFFMRNVDNEESVKNKILNQDITMKGECWSCVSSSAKSLLRLMLKKCPRKRISAKDALQHNWFKLSGKHAKDKAKSNLTRSVFDGLKDWQIQNRIKKAILKFIAKEISDEDIKEIREKFQALDKRCDGTITIDELKKSIKNTNCSICSRDLQQLIGNADLSNQRNIGYNEFIGALLSRRMNLKEVQLREIFDKIDYQKKGMISINDLIKSMKQPICGCKITEESLQRQFREIDKNGDGFIDFTEFLDLLLP